MKSVDRTKEFKVEIKATLKTIPVLSFIVKINVISIRNEMSQPMLPIAGKNTGKFISF